MDPWKMRFLLETIISRFHVNFWRCTNSLDFWGVSVWPPDLVHKHHAKASFSAGAGAVGLNGVEGEFPRMQSWQIKVFWLGFLTKNVIILVVTVFVDAG